MMLRLKWLSLKEVNQVIADAPKSTWQDGFKVPPIHANVLKGAKDGKPKKAGRFRYTAYNMRKFALARFIPFPPSLYSPSKRATFSRA